MGQPGYIENLLGRDNSKGLRSTLTGQKLLGPEKSLNHPIVQTLAKYGPNQTIYEELPQRTVFEEYIPIHQKEYKDYSGWVGGLKELGKLGTTLAGNRLAYGKRLSALNKSYYRVNSLPYEHIKSAGNVNEMMALKAGIGNTRGITDASSNVGLNTAAKATMQDDYLRRLSEARTQDYIREGEIENARRASRSQTLRDNLNIDNQNKASTANIASRMDLEGSNLLMHNTQSLNNAFEGLYKLYAGKDVRNAKAGMINANNPNIEGLLNYIGKHQTEGKARSIRDYEQ